MYHGQWVSHMVQKHWRSWNCPFCPSIKCSSATILQNHVSHQHPDEVPSSKLDSFISLCGTFDSSRCRGTCPLCSVFDIETSDQYQSHIKQHLEQLTASVFSDILDQVATGRSEALIKHSSASHEQSGDAGLSSGKRSSPDATDWTTLHSPEPKSSIVSFISDQLKSIWISRRTPEPQKMDADMGSSAVDRAHQPQSEANTLAGGIAPPEASTNPDRTHEGVSTSSSHVTKSSGVSSPTSDIDTHPLRPQTSQNASNATRNAARGYQAKPAKGSTVYIWSCCYCGHGGMNAIATPVCVSCGVARCGNCYMESHKIRVP